MQIKELIKINPSTTEVFKWFHPDDYDELTEFDGKKLLVFGMSDGSLIGFEYQEGDALKVNSYNVYEIIRS